jgi:deoxyribodipyrimidine photo-lyase
VNSKSEVPEVKDFKPGEDEGIKALIDGEKGFLSKKRFILYDKKSNNPNTPSALSGLSPYIHFGQISA